MSEERFKDYTVHVENGVQYIYFKGDKLPHQRMTIVKQDTDMALGQPALCEIQFTVLGILKDTENAPD